MYCRTSKNQDSVWLRIDWSPCVTKKVSICSTFAVFLLQLNGLCIQSRLSSASYVDLLLANLTAPFSAFTDSKGSLIGFDTRWSRCDATHDGPDSQMKFFWGGIMTERIKNVPQIFVIPCPAQTTTTHLGSHVMREAKIRLKSMS